MDTSLWKPSVLEKLKTRSGKGVWNTTQNCWDVEKPKLKYLRIEKSPARTSGHH